MRIYIEYNRVLEHTDMIAEEANVCRHLIRTLNLALKEVTPEDSEKQVQIKRAIRDAEKLLRNISGRQRMIKDIVDILKRAKVEANNTIEEIESEIRHLSSGGGYE